MVAENFEPQFDFAPNVGPQSPTNIVPSPSYNYKGVLGGWVSGFWTVGVLISFCLDLASLGGSANLLCLCRHPQLLSIFSGVYAPWHELTHLLHQPRFGARTSLGAPLQGRETFVPFKTNYSLGWWAGPTQLFFPAPAFCWMPHGEEGVSEAVVQRGPARGLARCSASSRRRRSRTTCGPLGPGCPRASALWCAPHRAHQGATPDRFFSCHRWSRPIG